MTNLERKQWLDQEVEAEWQEALLTIKALGGELDKLAVSRLRIAFFMGFGACNQLSKKMEGV